MAKIGPSKGREIASAQADVHKGDVGAPRRGAASGSARHAVGVETRPDMAGAQKGQPTEKMPVVGSSHPDVAVRELKEQHPHHYSDHGPHHGTADHIRHQPLHGMSPAKGYGR